MRYFYRWPRRNKSMRNQALESMKKEIAAELGISLKQDGNGSLTTSQSGKIGGEMVRRMIKAQEQQMRDN
ncbi:MAG: hypothetical protein ATN31_09770 [Candidatus Epulonipiscioides saccharophilum]|nr:MAG: hypothetical protein ATN31_09770 [Epulopiscium sp. AS2M-Bin001]